jgi:hypothetical protein
MILNIFVGYDCQGETGDAKLRAVRMTGLLSTGHLEQRN